MTENSKSRVFTSKCTSCRSGVEKSVCSLLDGILSDRADLLSAGSKVLIKPNLLTDREPEKAVTTHPEVVRCIIRYLKKLDVEVSVADSPASAVKVERVRDVTGFKVLCEEEDVPLLNLEKAGSEERTSDGQTFHISKPVLDADLVISVSKVKTHTLTVLTAAVKNQAAIFHQNLP